MHQRDGYSGDPRLTPSPPLQRVDPKCTLRIWGGGVLPLERGWSPRMQHLFPLREQVSGSSGSSLQTILLSEKEEMHPLTHPMHGGIGC